jgi:predicted ATPase
MYITKMKIINWRNFKSEEVDFSEITYILGPNAAGKSNFLEVFRFLRDVSKPQGGGLQQALSDRGGLSKVRCFAARKNPHVGIEVTLSETINGAPKWLYALLLAQETRGKRQAYVAKEQVFSFEKGIYLLDRPNDEDKQDRERLTQTALEQINANADFREIAAFFADVLYLHLVPQLLKHGNELAVKKMTSDPFGQEFLENIARTPEKTRSSRLKRIENILKNAIHDLQELSFDRDDTGTPHLQIRYSHWRVHGGFQQESDFSDGTLRLIALVWTLLESNSVILLEEPELSLHKKIIEQIPGLIQKARQTRKKTGGQILISTHSEAMLSSPVISGNYLILTPSPNGEGTRIGKPSSDDLSAMAAGMTPAEIMLPQTETTIGELDIV